MNARPLLLSALVFLPSTLLAQDAPTDPTPFHGGQWAMQFGGGSSLFNLGVLRFTSPKSAWLLDVEFLAILVNGKRTVFGSGTEDSDDKLTQGNIRLGRRFYRTPRGRIVSFQSIAVEGGYYDRTLDFSVGARSRIQQWNAGLYWEAGAAYRVTSSLSLGGTASISSGYLYRKREDPGNTFKGGGFYFQGLQVLFAVGIYF